MFGGAHSKRDPRHANIHFKIVTSVILKRYAPQNVARVAQRTGKTKMLKKIGCVAAIVLIVVAGLTIGFRYFWVFGEGVKAGELNFITYKGYIFKTYEGRLIQSGFRAGQGSLVSNEFDFSVERKDVADSLMRCSGKLVELHYREYKGALMWRGMSEYVVDSIVSVKTPNHTTPLE